jgi:glycosyltransferase involved in cell wall biosynthesis
MNSKPEEQNIPLVSINCITYNHAPYIRNAIKGFLMQKTNFPIEILIHDDASTDGTVDIIREYEALYPNLIKPIYQTENQYSKGKNPSQFNRERALGKYIAICEGDDYWTDPNKLQLQVDFLEANLTFSGCFNACEIDYIQLSKKKYKKHRGKSEFDLPYYLINNIRIETCCLILRKKVVEDFPKWAANLFATDFVITYLVLTKGKIKYFDKVMCVYRKGVLGSWSLIEQTQHQIDKEYLDNLFVLYKINELTNYKYSQEIIIKSERLFIKYMRRSINAGKENTILSLFIKNFYFYNIAVTKLFLKRLIKTFTKK